MPEGQVESVIQLAPLYELLIYDRSVQHFMSIVKKE
jgi:hypothetical protein